jgi:rhamnogalacturonan endolyase
MNRCAPILFFLLVMTAAGLLAEPAETPGRGIVALPHSDGVVMVGWRLRASDPSDVSFRVYRQDLYGDPDYILLTSSPVKGGGTVYLDREAKPGHSYRYRVQAIINGKEIRTTEAAYVTALDRPRPYLSIALDGSYRAQSVGFGDLNGDGVLDFVIKQPNFNTDPYHRARYWKRSKEPFKLEAYSGVDGKLLWRYDMGWAIETGVWYAPFIVYDLDQDGYAEVYSKAGEGDPRAIDGRVLEGPEYLVKIDGRSGEIVKKRDWHSREGWDNYNRSMRNMLAIAYLDGKSPALIMQRGTYDLMKTAALDKNLQEIWKREARNPHPKVGPGTHGLITADVDEDGFDELVLGSTTLDSNGKILWATGLGHPDPCFVADIDPRNDGLEVFFGIEPGRESHGVCLASARDGNILWFYDGVTKHVHSKGMIGDIDPGQAGIECYAGESDGSQYWLYASDGTRLSDQSFGTLSPHAVWWDADPQKEMIVGDRLFDYPDDTIMKIEGRVLAVTDCLGDWREEILTSLDGELRIYSSLDPVEGRQPWLMDDRQYRLGVVAGTMGYYREPQLSTGLSLNR